MRFHHARVMVTRDDRRTRDGRDWSTFDGPRIINEMESTVERNPEAIPDWQPAVRIGGR